MMRIEIKESRLVKELTSIVASHFHLCVILVERSAADDLSR